MNSILSGHTGRKVEFSLTPNTVGITTLDYDGTRCLVVVDREDVEVIVAKLTTWLRDQCVNVPACDP